ncbi:RsmE family RNA methyltransferase [Rhodopirellula sp. MGV]|uniref:RsmE family RNA methyltransferase n=1 Tax=Rhodopirellula sp. MGV TaxID=2023130 RepID=UPI001E3554DE|nr:RsmE family RNA methyltransferase [Rhodopirellula sp. MGV]
MTRRYFVSDLPSGGGTFPLCEDEARHAARVMRLQTGDSIELFDGSGHQATAAVTAIDKRSCLVTAEPSVAINREPAIQLTLAIALPKGDRAKELIERLAELGVHAIVPLICDRSQRPPSSSQLEKLRRVVIESCKQSTRNMLMEIDEARSFADWLKTAGSMEVAKCVAHPGAESLRERASQLVDESTTASKRTPVIFVIGPEGGLTDSEVAEAQQNGFGVVGLGPRIYRIETAACLIAAQLTDC